MSVAQEQTLWVSVGEKTDSKISMQNTQDIAHPVHFSLGFFFFPDFPGFILQFINILIRQSNNFVNEVFNYKEKQNYNFFSSKGGYEL